MSEASTSTSCNLLDNSDNSPYGVCRTSSHPQSRLPASFASSNRPLVLFFPLSCSQPPSAYPILGLGIHCKVSISDYPSRPSLSETLFLNFTLHRKISQPPAISPRTVCEICELRRKSRLWDLGTAEPASFPPAVSFLVPNSHLTQLRRSPATDSPCADSPSNSIPSTE